MLSIYGTSTILCEFPEVAAAGSETFLASAFSVKKWRSSGLEELEISYLSILFTSN